MTIFEGLILAHILGDWLLQTEWQAENKQHNWKALLTHLVIYHAVVVAVLAWGFDLDGWPVIAVVAVLVFTHALLDRRATLLWIMKTLRLTVDRTPERWMRIVIDQALHVVLIGAAAVYLSQVASR